MDENADIEFPELVRTSSSQAYNKQVRFKKYNFMAPPKPPAADMLTSYLVHLPILFYFFVTSLTFKIGSTKVYSFNKKKFVFIR